MTRSSIAVVLLVSAIGTLVGCTGTLDPHGMTGARAALVSSLDGTTVYDTTNHVTWLADANLPARNTFGLPTCTGSGPDPCVNASGSMNYPSAVAWVAAMNAARYLGHADWRLPTTPAVDPTCAKTGPNGNSFGFGCTQSALGSLYYTDLGLAAPNTAVPIPDNTVGFFNNLQPYLYWSSTPGGNDANGVATFSFNTGYQGGNTSDNFLYVLPMIPGPISPPGPGLALQPSGDGKTVYDPRADITWLADANLPAEKTFGLPYCTDPTTPKLCVNHQDGSMTWDSAKEWVDRMNKADDGAGYLHQTNWQLPPSDPNCPAYDCTGGRNPLGELYYKRFGLSQGMPVVAAPATAEGPFKSLQPYLYWACQAETFQAVCNPAGPAPNYEWSFSFGNGFEGTTLLSDDLYVTAYFPGPWQGQSR